LKLKENELMMLLDYDFWGTDIVCTKWYDKASGETRLLVHVMFSLLSCAVFFL
jgi:hypothetical protein